MNTKETEYVFKGVYLVSSPAKGCLPGKERNCILQCTVQGTDTVPGYIEPGTLPRGYNAAAACKNSAL
jgi:hypothetical protein